MRALPYLLLAILAAVGGVTLRSASSATNTEQTDVGDNQDANAVTGAGVAPEDDDEETAPATGAAPVLPAPEPTEAQRNAIVYGTDESSTDDAAPQAPARPIAA